MRLWAGKQTKGEVEAGKWKGREPYWNFGIHVRSEEVSQGLKVSEVAETIKSALNAKFGPRGFELVISPKAQDVLDHKHDGLK